jgi:magnesium and cobalt transporter
MLMKDPQDRTELRAMLQRAQAQGLLDADAEAMMEGVISVCEMQVREVMIPRAQMTTVARQASYTDAVQLAVNSGYSRFPVIGEKGDEVVGILLAKDLLRYAGSRESFRIRELLRPAIFAPESKRLNVLLAEFRLSRNHMVIVVDEFGSTAGLVTIEDVLEQIVGDIGDETDRLARDFIVPRGDERFLIQAMTEIAEFNDYFGTQWDDSELDTIGGLITQRLGRVPRRGEQVIIGGFEFTVVRADSRRIHLVEARRLHPEAGEPSS